MVECLIVFLRRFFFRCGTCLKMFTFFLRCPFGALMEWRSHHETRSGQGKQQSCSQHWKSPVPVHFSLARPAGCSAMEAVAFLFREQSHKDDKQPTNQPSTYTYGDIVRQQSVVVANCKKSARVWCFWCVSPSCWGILWAIQPAIGHYRALTALRYQFV